MREGAEKVTWVRRMSKGAKGSERILKKRESSRGEESKTRLRQPSRKRKVARAQEIVVVTSPIQSNPSHLPCRIPGNAISPLSRPPSKGGWPRSPNSLRRINESGEPPLGPLERRLQRRMDGKARLRKRTKGPVAPITSLCHHLAQCLTVPYLTVPTTSLLPSFYSYPTCVCG